MSSPSEHPRTAVGYRIWQRKYLACSRSTALLFKRLALSIPRLHSTQSNNSAWVNCVSNFATTSLSVALGNPKKVLGRSNADYSWFALTKTATTAESLAVGLVNFSSFSTVPVRDFAFWTKFVSRDKRSMRILLMD
jgi:hypothetical protein